MGHDDDVGKSGQAWLHQGLILRPRDRHPSRALRHSQGNRRMLQRRGTTPPLASFSPRQRQGPTPGMLRHDGARGGDGLRCKRSGSHAGGGPEEGRGSHLEDIQCCPEHGVGLEVLHQRHLVHHWASAAVYQNGILHPGTPGAGAAATANSSSCESRAKPKHMVPSIPRTHLC